jgi:hypothetical protein
MPSLRPLLILGLFSVGCGGSEGTDAAQAGESDRDPIEGA